MRFNFVSFFTKQKCGSQSRDGMACRTGTYNYSPRERRNAFFSRKPRVGDGRLLSDNLFGGGLVASLTVRLVRAPKPAVLRVISPLVLPELNVTTGWPLHFFDVRLL